MLFGDDCGSVPDSDSSARYIALRIPSAPPPPPPFTRPDQATVELLSGEPSQPPVPAVGDKWR